MKVTNINYFFVLCKEHDARKVTFQTAKNYSEAVWYEGPTFAWLLSAKDKNGNRRIIAYC